MPGKLMLEGGDIPIEELAGWWDEYRRIVPVAPGSSDISLGAQCRNASGETANALR